MPFDGGSKNTKMRFDESIVVPHVSSLALLKRNKRLGLTLHLTLSDVLVPQGQQQALVSTLALVVE